MSYIKNVFTKNFSRPSAQATVTGVHQITNSATQSDSVMQMLSMIKDACHNNQTTGLSMIQQAHQAQIQHQFASVQNHSQQTQSQQQQSSCPPHQHFYHMPVPTTPHDVLNLNIPALHTSHASAVQQIQCEDLNKSNQSVVPSQPQYLQYSVVPGITMPLNFEEFVPSAKSQPESAKKQSSQNKYHAARAVHPKKLQKQQQQAARLQNQLAQARADYQQQYDMNQEAKPQPIDNKSAAQIMTNFGMVAPTPTDQMLQQDVLLSQQLGFNRNNKLTKKQFQTQDDFNKYVDSFRVKYKTEMCRNWELTGDCEFQDSCSFAHGNDELQKKIDIPKNYKTKPCKRFHEEQYCPYGSRCQFLHDENLKKDNQKQQQQQQNQQTITNMSAIANPQNIDQNQKLSKSQIKSKIRKARQMTNIKSQSLTNQTDEQCSPQDQIIISQKEQNRSSDSFAEPQLQAVLDQMNLDHRTSDVEQNHENIKPLSTTRKRLQVFEEITLDETVASYDSTTS